MKSEDERKKQLLPRTLSAVCVYCVDNKTFHIILMAK